jgi:hypothetical protein
VSHIVDVVFLQKCGVDDPRSVRDDLVHPTTMADSFATFCVFHDTFEFMLLYLLVIVHANKDIHVRKRQLGLAKLQGMTEIFLSVRPTSDRRNLSRRTRSGRGHIHLEPEAKLVRQASQSEQIRTICVNAHRPTDWGFVDLVFALWFTVNCTAYECLYIF